MRIALIADLHGNRQATEALEKDLLQVQPDEIWCLGDLVGKGPASVYTCDWVFQHCSLILRGNWDDGIGGKHYPADTVYWEALGEERLEKLSSLPWETTVYLSGRRIRLFHGRPIMEHLLGVKHAEEDILPYFTDADGNRWDLLIYADTHRQGLRTFTPGYFVNVGSVGNSLGEPHACYAILEGKPGMEKADFELRFRQLEYDREAAAAEALASDMPNGDLFAREVLTGHYSRNKSPCFPR